jgi:hypothetical protein
VCGYRGGFVCKVLRKKVEINFEFLNRREERVQKGWKKRVGVGRAGVGWNECE